MRVMEETHMDCNHVSHRISCQWSQLLMMYCSIPVKSVSPRQKGVAEVLPQSIFNEKLLVVFG